MCGVSCDQQFVVRQFKKQMKAARGIKKTQKNVLCKIFVPHDFLWNICHCLSDLCKVFLSTWDQRNCHLWCPFVAKWGQRQSLPCVSITSPVCCVATTSLAVCSTNTTTRIAPVFTCKQHRRLGGGGDQPSCLNVSTWSHEPTAWMCCRQRKVLEAWNLLTPSMQTIQSYHNAFLWDKAIEITSLPMWDVFG